MHMTLPRPLRRLGRRVAALKSCTSGLAMTEFAYALPVLLTLCLMGLETANFAMAHLRVSNIAMMAADGAARVRDSIDESDIIELLTGAKMTGDDIDFAQNGRIILSDLEYASATKQWIRWQRCDGALNVAPAYGRPLKSNGTAITDGTEIYQTDRVTRSTAANESSPTASTMTGMGRTGNRITSQSGTAVMMVEVVYRYQPLIPNSMLENRIIRYESGFNVRQRTNQSPTNLARVTPRRCSTFQA